jgi:hypothetical protein
MREQASSTLLLDDLKRDEKDVSQMLKVIRILQLSVLRAFHFYELLEWGLFTGLGAIYSWPSIKLSEINGSTLSDF